MRGPKHFHSSSFITVTSSLSVSSYSFELALHSLRRSMLAAHVLELFPTQVFNQLAISEAGEPSAAGKIASLIQSSIRQAAFSSGADYIPEFEAESEDADDNMSGLDCVFKLRRHLVDVMLMCYGVVILYFVANSKRQAADFILALNFSHEALSFIPGTNSSLFDRELVLLHASVLMNYCNFPKDVIKKAGKICMLMFEEERRRHYRDLLRNHYLMKLHSPCKDKFKYGA
ncbi:unnamed protein product [Thelazia callipaeda]|uniref:NR LBD domain-containing protein n=1 Tax=Thelazia callipaeda TaxID=103827 RepID=A0A0N5CPS3_THECL|nr:unnamed protein product [Thelazia callipaeda]